MYKYYTDTQIARITQIMKDLSYKIIGLVYEVYNRLQYGHREKVYQEALAKELQQVGLKFKRESYSSIRYKGYRVGSNFYDFLIESKIVLELKVGNEIYESHAKQLLSYLHDSKMKLGILAVYCPKGVVYKRLVN